MVTSLQHMILVISFIVSFYLLWTDAAVTHRASAFAFSSSVGLPMASHEVQESMSPTALFQPILTNCSLVQIHREHLVIPVISADNTKICVDLPRSSSPCSALVSVPPTERTGMSPMEINRRKLNKLNLVKIYEEILNPAVPMALRLSSILMGGVVIVYERKVKILYDDVQRLLVEVNEAWTVKSVTDRNVLPKGKSQAKYEAATLPDHHEEMEIGAGECAGFRSDINGFRSGEESMRTILLSRRFCKFAFQKRFCNSDPVGTTLHSTFAFPKGLCICIQRCGSCSLYTREHLVPRICDCLRQFTFGTTKLFVGGVEITHSNLYNLCIVEHTDITTFSKPIGLPLPHQEVQESTPFSALILVPPTTIVFQFLHLKLDLASSKAAALAISSTIWRAANLIPKIYDYLRKLVFGPSFSVYEREYLWNIAFDESIDRVHGLQVILEPEPPAATKAPVSVIKMEESSSSSTLSRKSQILIMISKPVSVMKIEESSSSSTLSRKSQILIMIFKTQYSISMDSTETIAGLKEKVNEVEGLPLNRFSLSFMGVDLLEGRSLRDYGIVLPTVARGDDDHKLYRRSITCKARELLDAMSHRPEVESRDVVVARHSFIRLDDVILKTVKLLAAIADLVSGLLMDAYAYLKLVHCSM